MDETTNNSFRDKLAERKVWLAVILNLFCRGLGYIYIGELKRGLLTFVVLMLLDSILILSYYLFPPELWLLLLIVVYLFVFSWLVFDTFKRTKKIYRDYELKKYNKWYFYTAVYAIFVVIFSLWNNYYKDMLIDTYVVPTQSMDSTVIKGDRFIVNRAAYGLQAAPFNKYFCTYNRPVPGEVVIYVHPGMRDEVVPKEEVSYIKRYIGGPGDVVEIKEARVYINNVYYEDPPLVKHSEKYVKSKLVNSMLFPTGCDWTENDYGPITVPQKGDTLKIDMNNLQQWKIFILREEGAVVYDDVIIKSVLEKGIYIVKKDYCFVLGDNRDQSLDSRFFGFIPVENISGRAELILYSKVPDGDFKWSRIAQRIR
ncbi:MAG: signal peptidase I [Ignavibacteriae bacterium]|nr:MAG: signal peptidase I [Ignavibacteriota bacterium]